MKAKIKIGIGALIASLMLVSMALLPVVSASDVSIKSAQKIDITPQEVELYTSPDYWDDTGELYAQFTTNVAGDVNVKTDTVTVLVGSEEEFDDEWEDQRYAANSLRILVWDDDTASGDDKLLDTYDSPEDGVNVWSNSNVKLTAYIDVHW
ncbi:hypothetical protein [uncultured Methanolobus sp.]|uniref:hypothetical protein n=1 Tax=uncultured Methanolobus sp. TaxID=218300 RepID=UPI002AAB131E|nr:hypothetical protein [uncultured Methanolobus sp.]